MRRVRNTAFWVTLTTCSLGQFINCLGPGADPLNGFFGLLSLT